VRELAVGIKMSQTWHVPTHRFGEGGIRQARLSGAELCSSP
jgi:hypothetical protein